MSLKESVTKHLRGRMDVALCTYTLSNDAVKGLLESAYKQGFRDGVESDPHSDPASDDEMQDAWYQASMKAGV